MAELSMFDEVAEWLRSAPELALRAVDTYYDSNDNRFTAYAYAEQEAPTMTGYGESESMDHAMVLAVRSWAVNRCGAV